MHKPMYGVLATGGAVMTDLEPVQQAFCVPRWIGDGGWSPYHEGMVTVSRRGWSPYHGLQS